METEQAQPTATILTFLERLALRATAEGTNRPPVADGFNRVAAIKPFYARETTETFQSAIRPIARPLTAGKGEAVEGDRVILGEWFEEFEPLIRIAMPTRLSLTIKASRDIWPIIVDRSGLSATLFDITANIRDAVAGMGAITIVARNNVAGGVSFKGGRLNESIVLSVVGTPAGGGGEADGQTARFRPLDRSRDGTASRLAAARTFARNAGGALVVRGAVGQSEMVDLILPRAHDADAAYLHAGFGTDAAITRRARVLLVDDDDDVRAVIAELLGALGYDVVQAGSAESAYDIARAEYNIDLVVSDVVMPGIDGVTLAALLRRSVPRLPIVFVTGHPRDSDLAGEMVLAKPFTMTGLGMLVAGGLTRTG